MHTLLKGENDKKFRYISFTQFNYKNEYKEYKVLTVLLTYLFDEQFDKVAYFSFKEKKSNGMYTLDREKYNFVLKSLKNIICQ